MQSVTINFSKVKFQKKMSIKSLLPHLEAYFRNIVMSNHLV